MVDLRCRRDSLGRAIITRLIMIIRISSLICGVREMKEKKIVAAERGVRVGRGEVAKEMRRSG